MVKAYYGKYVRSLDGKGRLLLPSNLGIGAGETLYLLRGLDHCIAVYDEAHFAAQQEKWMELSYSDKDTRAYLRIALPSVVIASVDNQNRILLSKSLQEEYGIDGRSATIIGMLDHLEIWSTSALEEYQGNNASSYEELAGKSR